MDELAKVADLIGVRLASVEGMHDGSECVTFTSACGRVFKMLHVADCCERVEIVDVYGDPADLVGTPIIVADESSSDELQPGQDAGESFTWTFYNFRTAKGSVSLRWLGESNGYYSERVEFVEVVKREEVP